LKGVHEIDDEADFILKPDVSELHLGKITFKSLFIGKKVCFIS
jgi:hypothetical protein